MEKKPVVSTNSNARLLLRALKEVKKGNFKVRLPDEWTGIDGEIAGVFNEIVEMNQYLLTEISRISKTVGKDGKVSQRIKIQNTRGSWTSCLESVNDLIDDTTQPILEISQIIDFVSKGNLTHKIDLENESRKGEFLKSAKRVNGMVDQLYLMTTDIISVASEVGMEGKLGGKTTVKNVSGIWTDLISSVESMANNLTDQVREIAAVSASVVNGDLSKKITVDARGEILDLKNIINAMVDQLSSFGSEVNRMARDVGTDGKLGGQAVVKGVAGIWKDLTDNVNSMASNLTTQVRNIAEVTKAVAQGNLSKKITVEARGEILELKDIINSMVDQLGSFASEVTRVAREVGTDGKLGGQAQPKGVSGTWKDLTDSVNSMANNLTEQVRGIAEVTTSVAKGDLTKKIEVAAKGEILQLRNTINTMVDQLSSFASEVTRVSREVGTDGMLGGQAKVEDVSGTWRDLTNNVNFMAKNLTDQVRNIAEVTTAVAKGDLTKEITVEAKGEIQELKNIINTMVGQLGSFASEVTRVAQEVGTDGKLGAQAEVEGVAGTWKDLTNSVNSMATNLTNQVRNIAEVTTGVANGDLSKKITVEASGEIMELKDTINTMVEQLNAFANEVTRVASDVGTEGILGGQAKVEGVAGIWKELTENVNSMANNLTSQVRNIAEVTTGVAMGDLSKKITVEASGEIMELKNTINSMVDQLNSFSSEVTRVSREVGADGILGGQAEVKGVAGVWKDLTGNVNFMANNLTAQVRNIAEVTTGVANGDLSKKITVEASGEIMELKNTINNMVDRLNLFSSEVTRVAREVGTDGMLGGQAAVKDVSGVWKDLTENVNSMANNLTSQVRNIAEVTKSVADGDLTKRITVEASGEIDDLKSIINNMVDQLSSFASEVTRVSREVGTDGMLGGQAAVEGVAGTWKDLTDNVNLMADNLTSQVRNIAEVTTAVAMGNLSKKISVEASGEIQDLKNTINTMVDQLSSFASEVTRVSREVGVDGKLGGQAEVQGVSGVWKDLTDNVNFMANNLTDQVRNIAEVTTAVANGDLSKNITVEAKGEILDLKKTINRMVEQLNSFGSEVTRVSREVGTDGILGGQAKVVGVGGIWKDLTDNVNTMAMNLTNQVRGIADVVTYVANGDLKQKLFIEARGEIKTLTNTINGMIDTLAIFADQVTAVAREVGVEGKLGGQADVPGAAGIWKDLTANVNQLANNLTNQVRAIASVATAVTQGDLSQTVSVEARGEVSNLSDNINEMILNLRDTTQTNEEQDWLKTNIARFTGLMQGQRDLNAVAKLILSEIASLVEAQHGVFYLMENDEEGSFLKLISSYAYKDRKNLSNRVDAGEGLIGQCLLEKQRILVQNVPENYIKIRSGLGEGTPYNLVVLPILFEDQVKAVIELATFHQFKDIHLAFLEQLTESVGIVLETISATMRTEQLLKQSQNMASDLQNQREELTETNQKLEEQAETLRESEERLKEQQEELTETNQELEEQAETLRESEERLKEQQEELQTANSELGNKARELENQNQEVERKNAEIQISQKAIEEKAEQLKLTNQYKSEFLANMSHELRTPLNSIMLLSSMLSRGDSGDLSEEQSKQLEVITESGKDLLTLINEVLDLSKIEAGKMEINIEEIDLKDFAKTVESTFRPHIEEKGIKFEIDIQKNVPMIIESDPDRLQQVMRNFISNAYKFTERGTINFQIKGMDKEITDHIAPYWVLDNRIIKHPENYLVFSISDTGVGIPEDKKTTIFEAFQQVDGTTSRKYGGTGLGLSICKGIADILNGAIALKTGENQGSTFSLILPISMEMTITESPKTEPGKLEKHIERVVPVPAPAIKTSTLRDDRDRIRGTNDKTILIVEDDTNFAAVLRDIAHEHEYKVLHASTGTEAIRLANEFLPLGILLDIKLPIVDGWEVLRQIKQNPATRHIPVHVLSIVADENFGYRLGAVGYLVKPIKKEQLEEAFQRIEAIHNKKSKNLLLVEDNDIERNAVVKLIEDKDVKVTSVKSGEEALAQLATGKYDTLVLDLRLPDMSGMDILKKIHISKKFKQIPTIVYTGKDLSIAEEKEIRKYAESIILKTANSPERLLEETTIFLHRVAANLGKEKQLLLNKLTQPDSIFKNKTVMIVDDDVRNTYTLTTALEKHGLTIISAMNGKESLDLLKKNADIDLVLMDIMMPVMDGFEAIKRIRMQDYYRDLPIIAVTAKAMKEDREKCIAAGASDYITKPIDYDRLFSVIRIWLSAVKSKKQPAEIAAVESGKKAPKKTVKQSPKKNSKKK